MPPWPNVKFFMTLCAFPVEDVNFLWRAQKYGDEKEKPSLEHSLGRVSMKSRDLVITCHDRIVGFTEKGRT
jgi:hypothetical protein